MQARVRKSCIEMFIAPYPCLAGHPPSLPGIILALATTLPEEFIAVRSGYRGRVGILVAHTVESNIPPVALHRHYNGPERLRVIFSDSGPVKIAELCVIWRVLRWLFTGNDTVRW